MSKIKNIKKGARKNKRIESQIVPQSNELGQQSVSPNLQRRQSVENVTFFFQGIPKKFEDIVRHSNELHLERKLNVLYLRVMN